MSNREAAASGDRRAALVALRDTLAEQLDTTEAQIHAQLAAQYRATLAELGELDAAAAADEEVSELDRIRARREARDRDAADRVSAAGRDGLRDG